MQFKSSATSCWSTYRTGTKHNISRIRLWWWWFSDVTWNWRIPIRHIYIDIQFWHQSPFAKYVYVSHVMDRVCLHAFVLFYGQKGFTLFIQGEPVRRGIFILFLFPFSCNRDLIWFFFLQILAQLYNSKRINSCQKHSSGWLCVSWPGSFLPKNIFKKNQSASAALAFNLSPPLKNCLEMKKKLMCLIIICSQQLNL